MRNVNDSSIDIIKNFSFAVAEWAYEKTHKDIEDNDGKEEYIEFFRYAFQLSLLLIYLPFSIVITDLIIAQAFSLVYSTSVATFFSFPFYRVFGFLFLLAIPLARGHRSLIHSESSWSLTEEQSLGFNHGGLLLTYGGALYSFVGFADGSSAIINSVMLFFVLTISIAFLYSESVNPQIDAEEFVKFDNKDLSLKTVLWDSAKRTLSLTGLFLVISTGFLDLAASTLLRANDASGIKTVAAFILFLLTFYAYGMTFRVFTYRESVSLSFRFFTRNFKNNLIAVLQVLLLFAVLIALNLMTIFGVASVGFNPEEPGIYSVLVFLPSLIELLIIPSFVFVPYYGIMSAGFISSFKKSWRLAAGNRFAVFRYGMIGFMIGIAIAIVLLLSTSILIQVFPGEISESVSTIFATSIFIYVIALFSDVFNILR